MLRGTKVLAWVKIKMVHTAHTNLKRLKSFILDLACPFRISSKCRYLKRALGGGGASNKIGTIIKSASVLCCFGPTPYMVN